MAAVIRLKRRVDEDPLNAFVLNCKRQRTNSEGFQQESLDNGNSGSDETSTVLKFAGTFEKADNIPAHLQQRLSKEEAKEVISRVHRPTIVSRNRAASRQTAHNSRFRIVNCTRSLSQTEGTEATTTIVDVERDIIAAAASASTSSGGNLGGNTVDAVQSQGAPNQEEPGYVYDLYIADESQQQTHISYIPDNLEDIRLVLVEDLYYTFFSFI